MKITKLLIFLVATSGLAVAMDQKLASESSPTQKALNEELVKTVLNKLNGLQKLADSSRLLAQGADINIKRQNSPLIFSVARQNNWALIRLFLSHPAIDIYFTESYEAYGTTLSRTLLEWAGHKNENRLLKLLIYLGHESYQDLNASGFKNTEVKKLIRAPHAYPFSEKEKKEYQDIARVVGANNGEKLKPIFTDLGLITQSNATFDILAPLIGGYLGFGLLTAKTNSSFSDSIADTCTIL